MREGVVHRRGRPLSRAPLRSTDDPQAGHLGKSLAAALEAADPEAGRAHRPRVLEPFIVVVHEVLKQDDLIKVMRSAVVVAAEVRAVVRLKAYAESVPDRGRGFLE